LLLNGTIWLDMILTWWAIRPWQRQFWSNNGPILIRKIIYYGVGRKLNVGVTSMWKYFSWDFCYGHCHCFTGFDGSRQE
jgi:hypothetical protein